MDMTALTPTDQELSLVEAASVAGVSTRTIRRAITEGKLPRQYVSTAHGAQLSLPRATIERWMAEREAEEDGQADTNLSTGQRSPDMTMFLATLVQQQADLASQTLTTLLSQWADGQKEAVTAALSSQQQALPALLASAQETLLARLDVMQGELASLRQELEAEPARKRPWWKFWG